MSKSKTKTLLALLKLPKPRNPLVAPAHRRRAGRHGRAPGAARQAARQQLIRDLAGFELPRDFADEG